MMNTEHGRPLAALLLLFAIACLIMGNGLRTQVVEVLIGAGAPRELIAAAAPDLVLGQSLSRAPQPPQATLEAPPEAPPPDDSDDSDNDRGPTTVTDPADRTDNRPVTRLRAGNTQSKSVEAADLVAPVAVATPQPAAGSTPAPKPEPTTVSGPRPGSVLTPSLPSPTPALPRNGSRDQDHHGGWKGGDRDTDRSDRDNGRTHRSDRDSDRRDHGERDSDRTHRSDRASERNDSRGRDSRGDSNDRDRNDRDSNDRDSNDRDSNDRDSNDRGDNRGHGN